MFDNPSKQKSTVAWPAAVGVLCILALGSAAWYGYPKLKRHDPKNPENAGIKQSLQALDGRLNQQNSKLAQWSAGQEQLQRQIADLRRELRSRIAAVKKQSGRSADELFRRVEADLTEQIGGIKASIVRLESSRDADQARIAALQNELNEVKELMAAQNKEFTERLAENGSAAQKELAALEASQDQNRKDIDGIHRKLGIRRVDFEVSKGRNTELAPGISLNVTGTDIAYRRVTGWMWVLPDRRTIWLRGQGAQEPVAFYSNADGMKRELVITSVTEHSAVGYLLVPEESAAAQSASIPPAPVNVNAAE